MRSFPFAMVFALSLVVGARAETLAFPTEKPIATITIPHSWEPEETESGVQGTSPDGAVYISVDVADAATVDRVVSDAIDFLSENGVTIDPATQKESTDTINGMEMQNLDWRGTDEDGKVSVGLSFASPSPDKLLLVTYWGTQGEQEKHASDIMAIITSLKPMK